MTAPTDQTEIIFNDMNMLDFVIKIAEAVILVDIAVALTVLMVFILRICFSSPKNEKI